MVDDELKSVKNLRVAKAVENKESFEILMRGKIDLTKTIHAI